MRAAIAVAAFAAGAIAVPYNNNNNNKRAIYTDWDIVYVTDIVTVTYGAQPTASSHHHGHHHTTTVPAAAPTYEAPASSYVYVPPPAPTTPEAAAYTPPAYTPPAPTYNDAPASSYQDIVVLHHNLHRRNHSVADVEWSDDLYSSAKEIAASCVYAHNVDVQGGGYGQNIAAGVSADNVSSIITDLFYNGEEPYFADQYGKDSPDMTNFELWGHFSQIVWKGTTHVACATQYCPGGLGNVGGDVSPYFTVCNYKGPGNYADEYGSNVLAPLGQASASWNTGLAN